VISTSGIIESVCSDSDRSVIFADSYINKLTGEQIEHECRRRIADGCRELELNFSNTEIVNSIGISILLGVIDTASNKGAKVVFADVNDETVELFEMLGLTNHVVIEQNEK
jgi:anti-anti-sigma regulatory factor